MSAAAISEYDGKLMISKHLGNLGKIKLIQPIDIKCCRINEEKTIQQEIEKETGKWMKEEKLVIKPDQLIKRRGKMGLVKVNKTVNEAEDVIKEWMNKEIEVQKVKGKLNTFIIEPFIKHSDEDEHYLCIRQTREGDEILFCKQGGIDVGDVDSKANKLFIPITEELKTENVLKLVEGVSEEKKNILCNFIEAIYEVFCRLYFTYLEINPLVCVNGKLFMLDLAAKLDQTAQFQSADLRGEIEYPAPWGRTMTPEEAYIHELDSQTGASLKLTILNPKGKVWLMVAGGGASVIFTDTVSDLGYANEIANYGEYSGDPSEDFTYKYAKTIFDLMTRGEPYPDGKVLIIGGGIANFTNVAATFKGIIRALGEFKELFHKHHIKVFVRRGGPNYREGLNLLSKKAKEFNIPMEVYGPELHMTAVVPMALGKTQPVKIEETVDNSTIGFDEATGRQTNKIENKNVFEPTTTEERPEYKSDPSYSLYDRNTQAIVIGLQPRAVQSMLDFDTLSGREIPSVAGIVYHTPRCQKFYWGDSEVIVPVYTSIAEALKANPNVTVAVNLESQRSAAKSSMDAMDFPQIKVVAIIAEGIPERHTRELIAKSKVKGVTVIGPATVGGIKPGCFRIANTGGMLDNIINSKLYRPGSVAYVSRSGGMSNELNNIISQNSDGVYEGVAIGGDRFPGSTFIDHIMRYERDPGCKMIVLLGEHGGKEEYKIINAIKEGKITKPLVAWCIGTCSGLLGSEVQFGHAGASANDDSETAFTKNKALREAGVYVPSSFNELGITIKEVFTKMVKEGKITVYPEPQKPRFKLDVAWAKSLGLIRKPTNFICTISDDRGDEVRFGPLKLSQCFEKEIGIGGVISCLWFKKQLPKWATKYIEMCIMMVADHGPAVSGAHNTIVASRAGKDLISSLVSGLLCIGPRFGGAIDNAAITFSEGMKKGLTPRQLISSIRTIPGIGHRIKSKDNPDKRVEILKEYIFKHFPKHETVDYALAVEDITTQKKATLILNVDGTIGVSMVDLLRCCQEEGYFTKDEVDTMLKCQVLNGLFVVGRSIGFIGHYLDQKRLNAEMYRHPVDDILYSLPPLEK